MTKNKHVVAALIMTPILAVLGYFAADYLVSEQPKKAQSGGQYALVQSPNCRYASGQCVLKNGDFSVTLKGSAEEGKLSLLLESAFPLQAAYVATSFDIDSEGPPVAMNANDQSNKIWSVSLSVEQPEDEWLRVVVSAQNAAYYGQTKMPFLAYQTSFQKDFRTP